MGVAAAVKGARLSIEVDGKRVALSQDGLRAESGKLKAAVAAALSDARAK